MARPVPPPHGLLAFRSLLLLSTKTVDAEELEVTPSQCRAGRALLDWPQPELAKAAGLGVSTVIDFERERRKVSVDAIAAMRAALVSGGIELTNGSDPGVKVRKARRR